jgi:hypothetical protein
MKKVNFEWGVFIEWYDNNGQQYEVMLSEKTAKIVHDEISTLLKTPKKSKAKLLQGDLNIKW